jgi:hypothetical protein
VVGLLLGVGVPMARVGEDVVRRCSSASRSLAQNVEQVVGGSSFVGTYHRASGVRARGYGQKAAAWAARCATSRVLQEMIMARRPDSVTEDRRWLGLQAGSPCIRQGRSRGCAHH